MTHTLRILAERHYTRAIVLLPDDRQVVVISGWRPNVLEIYSGKVQQSLEGDKGVVNAVAVTSGKRPAISVAKGKTGIVWDLATGRPRLSLRLGLKVHIAVTIIAAAPNGREVAFGCSDSTLKGWDITSSPKI